MEKFGQLRRKLIKTLFFAAGSVFLLKFLHVPSSKNGRKIKINMSSIPYEGALVLKEEHIAIVSREGSIDVFDTTCTHLGCRLNLLQDKMQCPCHGSEFSYNGNVLKGPAEKNLNRYKFHIVSNTLEIFKV